MHLITINERLYEVVDAYTDDYDVFVVLLESNGEEFEVETHDLEEIEQQIRIAGLCNSFEDITDAWGNHSTRDVWVDPDIVWSNMSQRERVEFVMPEIVESFTKSNQ